MRAETITRTDLMVALSRATDLATGRPIGFAMKAALLADRLARQLQLSTEERTRVLEQGLLRYIGCNSESHAMAALLGDEIAFRRDFALIDAGRQQEVMALVWKHLRKAHQQESVLIGFLDVLKGFAGSRATSAAILSGHCEVAERLGQRLGLGADVCEALGQLYARWDGKGLPQGLAGHAIALPVRIVTLAQDAVVLEEAFGWPDAKNRIKSRAGKAYDPALVALISNWADLAESGVNDAVLKSLFDEVVLESEALDTALLALADFIDVKTPHTLGHSRQLSDLAAAAARIYGLPQTSVALLRRAALLHDIGYSGVPASVMAKPAALDAGEWEQVRLHAYYGARILAESEGLQPLSRLVAEHHERLDGSGYHNGTRAVALSIEARLLAAAEAYQNRIEARPYRPALTPANAAQALQRHVRDGKLDGEAVKAVLAAAGQLPARLNRKSMDLTPRELEILRLLCRGLSMKEVARALSISPKTVDNHIQSIHAKTGMRSRGGLILHAMEQGWVGSGSD